MKTKNPSPSRSQGAHTPRRKPRRTLSVGSPALSTASGRLSSVVQGFINEHMNSFALSPLPKRRSVLTDQTDVMEEPRRKSWWNKLNDNSRNVLEILEDNNLAQPNNIMEELDIEILSQEKKNCTLDIPESSDGESIHSIVIPQKKLFPQKESQHQKIFGQIIETRETMTKTNINMTINDKAVNAGTKQLFQNKPRTKLLFPAALLDISPDKTVMDKTKPCHDKAEPKTQARNLFGNRQGTKRKNMFADFIVSESEDEISEIQPRVFGFTKKPTLIRRASSASRGVRESSPTSNATTDTDMDEWRLLPSSTMVDHQLEAMMEPDTPKRPRLSKLTETKESSGANTVFSKTKSPEVNTSILTRSRLRELNNSTSTAGEKNKTQEKSIQNRSKKNNRSQNNESKDKIKESNINSEQNEDENLKMADISQGKMNKSKGKHNKSLQKTIVSLTVGDGIQNDQTKLNTSNNINKKQSKVNEPKDKTQNDSNERNLDKSQEIVDSIHNEDQSQEVVDGIQTESVALEANQSQQKIYEKQKLQNEFNVNLENSKQKVISESQEVGKSKEVNEMKTIDENKEINVAEQEEAENQEREINNENEEIEIQDAEDDVLEESQDRIHESQVQDDENEEQANESQHCDENMEQKDEGQAVEQSLGEVDESNEAINQSQENHEKDNEEIDQTADNINESNDVADGSIKMASQSQKEEEVDENNEDINQTQEEQTDDDENEATHDENTQEEINESNEDINQTQEEQGDDDENEAIHDENTQEVDGSNEHINQTQEEVDESNEVNEIQLAIEDDENEATDHDENTQEEVDESNEENISQEDDENEDDKDEDEEQSENAELHYESAREEMEVDNDPQNDEDNTPIDQENYTNTPEPAHNECNSSHDTTGRHRNKHTSPEAILYDITKQPDSFTARRRTSNKTKSIGFKTRDSVGLSDGTTNSSAEGSGWDSHRTTRKTIRQTFGKDATLRKSLRALVMEKSAKRQTLAQETAKVPLANSTEMPEISLGYLDVQPHESTHEVSLRTRQMTLDAVLDKIKEDRIKKKAEIEEAIKKSLETRRSDAHIFKVPYQPMFPRRQANQNQKKTSKVKAAWQGLPEEMIQDLQYKPPKRFKPRNTPWITKRLYKYLENKLEPKYNYKARVRAEKLVETIYNFAKDLRRQLVASEDATNVLKHEMARLHIVRTHHDFYEFFRLFMPKEVRIKVIPDVVNKLPMPKSDVFSDILTDSAQG